MQEKKKKKKLGYLTGTAHDSIRGLAAFSGVWLSVTAVEVSAVA